MADGFGKNEAPHTLHAPLPERMGEGSFFDFSVWVSFEQFVPQLGFALGVELK